MDGDGIGLTLPQGPSGLCFEKDIFMKSDFDVDSFVLSCKKRVTLEILRDDLSVYLKILQSAMIELINKDYADFVNLSTNLVGMDKAIKNLTVPLGQLREEVLSVRSAMDNAITAVEDKLEYRQKLQDKKESLQRLVSISKSVDKIERLLSSHSSSKKGSSSTNDHLSGKLIERVATEFNKLQFYVTKSWGHPLVESVKPRIVAITTTLQNSLEGAFIDGLETSNKDILRQCLRTYALIDKTSDAETLFSQHVLRPRLKEIITEQAIKAGLESMKNMYLLVLQLVPDSCQILANVTSAEGYGDEIRGFDFVVNSLWPEVVTALETQAASIFAPGNPVIFHQRYSESMKFLERFENLCTSRESVENLREHPSYNHFLSKWSLPVYFQIRFQEIAGSLETVLCGSQSFDASSANDPFRMATSDCLWSCLQSCWRDDIFLPSLSHRFLKLTFQLVSRYTLWLDATFKERVSREKCVDQSQLNHKSNFNEEPGGNDTSEVKDASALITLSTSQIVALIFDIHTLSEKLVGFCDEAVLPKLVAVGVQNEKSIKDCFVESRQTLLSKLPAFNNHIASSIMNRCSTSLKQVNDIPRLYRRTNRDAPSSASKYMSGVKEPLCSHFQQYSSSMKESSRRQLTTTVISSLADQYVTMTGDVLTSVKRVEDSLKRLKKARGGDTSSGSGTLSDDDKIRAQIVMDIDSFISWIHEFDVAQDLRESVTNLDALRTTARSAMTS